MYFDDKSPTQKKKEDDKKVQRSDFAKELINIITGMNKEVSLQILEVEKIFYELKKLSEKPPNKNTDSTMDMPPFLTKI